MSVEPGQSSGGPADGPADGPTGGRPGGGRFSALLGSLTAVTSHDRGDQGDQSDQSDQSDQGDQGGSGGQRDAGGGEAPVTRPTFTARGAEPGAAGAPGEADAPGAGDPGRDTVPVPAAVPGPRAFAPPGAPAVAPGDEPTPPLPGLAAVMPDDQLLGDADRLRARWQGIQAGFVDDPSQAVGDAADLIEQTAQALIGALRQRQRQLRVMWESGPHSGAGDGESADRAPQTEHLRLMMQRYRALFNQLCP
jgi:hypothetical protein